MQYHSCSTAGVFFNKDATLQVCLFVDIHGHSRKQDAFLYGCNEQPGKAKGFKPSSATRTEVHVLPWILQHTEPGLFSYSRSTFGVARGKESTARSVACRQMGLKLSYTLEASLCGPSSACGQRRHFQTHDYERMGATLVNSLHDLFDERTFLAVSQHLLERSMVMGGSGGFNSPPCVDSFLLAVLDMSAEMDSWQGHRAEICKFTIAHDV